MLWSNLGGLNDSLLDIAWYQNVSDIIGIYHEQDTINYFTGGNFDRKTGQIILGNKYPFYRKEPVKLVYQYRYDSTNVLNWYGGVSCNVGFGKYIRCYLPEAHSGEKNLTPYLSFIEANICVGKKSFSTSLGIAYSSNSLLGLTGPDTIENSNEKIAPYVLIDFTIPLLIHYRLPITENLYLCPEIGCTYLGFKDEYRAYDKLTTIETVNINENKKTLSPQFGCNVKLLTPIRLWNWRGQKSHLFVSGKYDYITAFSGIHNFDLNIGQYTLASLPFWSKGEFSFVFQQSQSDWFLSRHYGVALTVMTNK